MAVPYHTHTFQIPSASVSDIGSSRDDVSVTPASLRITNTSDAEKVSSGPIADALTAKQNINIINSKSGLTRRLQDKVEEGSICLTDFGATEKNNTTGTLALQNAISQLQALGKRCVLKIPEGEFWFTQPVSIIQDGTKPLIDLRGEGKGHSKLKYQGGGFATETPLITYACSSWGVANSVAPSIGGFSLETWGAPNTIGMYVDKFVGMIFDDMFFTSCTTGLSMRDAILFDFKNVGWNYNQRGVVAIPGPDSPGIGSAPNLFHFDNCAWVSNFGGGMRMVGCGQIKITGGNFEANGRSTTLPLNERYAAKYENCGHNGLNAVTYDTVHHEGSGGIADIWIDHQVLDSHYRIINTDFFHRGGDPWSHSVNQVRIDTTGQSKCSVSIEGGGFHGVNGYVGSTSRKAVDYGTIVGNLHQVHISDDVMFMVPEEVPTIDYVGSSDSDIQAYIRFDGTQAGVTAGTAGIIKSRNISSLRRIGTGDYVFGFTRSVRDVRYASVGTCCTGSVSAPVPGVLVPLVDGQTTEGLRVQTYGLNGTTRDFTNVTVAIIGSGNRLWAAISSM